MNTKPSRRDEARDPATSPERLHELIHLPGDRGDIDSDAGWCREYVAANPSAAPDTLDELAADDNDFLARLYVARNPSTRRETLQKLAQDGSDQVRGAVFRRLGDGTTGLTALGPPVGMKDFNDQIKTRR